MKLRILCLHGYRQDGEGFNKRIGALRKRLKGVAEFEFLDGGVYVADGDESRIPEESGRVAGRGWWFSRPDKFFRATHYSDYVEGFQESVSAVKRQWLQCGPYDGLLGFSQGAAFAAMLCCMQHSGALQTYFRFAVLVAAFKSRSSLHDEYYSPATPTPSLHIIGSSDQVIEPSMSEELAALFADATIVRHEGGHFVPSSATVAAGITSFLSRFTSAAGELQPAKVYSKVSPEDNDVDKEKNSHSDGVPDS